MRLEKQDIKPHQFLSLLKLADLLIFFTISASMIGTQYLGLDRLVSGGLTGNWGDAPPNVAGRRWPTVSEPVRLQLG